MSAQQPSSEPPWLGRNFYKGGYSSRGFKSDEVGNGSEGRRTAEGTILEIRMILRMEMMPMVGTDATDVVRAELHQERGATRGHKPHWDIGAKDERGQQYDSQNIRSPSVTVPSLHDWGRHHARVSVIVPLDTVASRCCTQTEIRGGAGAVSSSSGVLRSPHAENQWRDAEAKKQQYILGSFGDFSSVGSDDIPDGIVRSARVKCPLHQQVTTPGDY